jgi:hypothetical protein
MTRTPVIAFTAGLLSLGMATGAHAGVSAEEADRLGKDLTPVGAIHAGNADGSIPEWTGRANFPQETIDMTREELERLRSDEPEELVAQFRGAMSDDLLNVQYTITRDNMAEYADLLTDGHKAMLETYPTFKMPVYKSVRTAFFPDKIYEETKLNATRASLEGTDSVQNAKIGFPFPIPQNGAEVIWNHKTKFRGSAAKRFNNQAIVQADGSYQLTKIIEDVKFKYANLDEQDERSSRIIAYYLSATVAPPRVAGQLTLVHETADQASGGRVAWIFSPGLGRVNRAPDVGYDNPAVGTDNEQYNDQIDVFNGALDRYTWKLIGRKEMLIPYNAYEMNSPLVTYKDLLTPNHVNPQYARFEKHRVWVVEANLKPGTRHNFAKRVFYVDEDSWSIAVVDCYDARGQLWKVQEAHLLTAPFVPTMTGIPEFIYDLQSKRYFATTLANEDEVTDFDITYEDRYFEPANLNRLARRR